MSGPVSVIVPTIGASPCLEACLDALLDQRDVEVDVVLVEQLAAKVPIRRSVRRVAAAGRGFAAAANAGLAQTASPLVGLVNDDAVVAEDWLVRLVEGLSATPDLASVQGTSLLGLEETARTLDGVGIAFNQRWQAVQIGHGRALDDLIDPGVPWFEVLGASATAALYRRDALERAGGGGQVFDESLESYYEDVDLACRLASRGARAGWVPGARVRHAGSASAASSPWTPRRRLLIRNRLVVVARLLGRSFFRALPGVLARDLLEGARRGGRGMLEVAAGWSAALRGLPGSLRLGAPLVATERLRRLGAEASTGVLLRSAA